MSYTTRGMNLKPSRVYTTAEFLLKSKTISQAPSWYKTIGSIPPGEILTRTQPPQHRESLHQRRVKKPSKCFAPQTIVYEEDALRTAFFKDHPWELARPRTMLENDGKDGQRCDWSHIQQPGRPLNGESVVQRWLWLMHSGMEKFEAYDLARKEFYALRHEEEVERRVAHEEALSTGAYFYMNTLEKGMKLEDKVYEGWKKWATKNVENAALANFSAYASIGTDTPDEQPVLEPDAALAR